MKRIIFLLTSLAILCNACKEDDSTQTTDITKSSWKIKSIAVDGYRSKTPNKDYHGNDISDNAYKLSFENDKTFNLYLGINSVIGKYKTPCSGKITFKDCLTTEKCCDSDFDEHVVKTIPLITSYQVLDDNLILKGKKCEIKLKKE
ncbi:MAG: META domain-containing protein [Bacteroidales bacterium]|nr:META domain-containing protein [Bacteroidales bacterium]